MLLTDFLAYANTFMVCVAFFVILWAIPKVGRPLNIILILAAVLAFVFATAYFLLLFGGLPLATFLIIVRWAGLATWPVVWIAPIIAMIKYKRNAGAMIRKASRPDNVITPIEGIDVQEILNRDNYSQ